MTSDSAIVIGCGDVVGCGEAVKRGGGVLRHYVSGCFVY